MTTPLKQVYWPGWPLQLHPRSEDNKQKGARVVQGVFERYRIETDRQKGKVVVGEGVISDSFPPFLCVELPSELAKLSDATDDEILEFAGTYGSLGPVALLQPHGGIEPHLAEPTRVPVSIAWIKAHANGIRLCLEIARLLASTHSPHRSRELRSVLASWEGASYGIGPARDRLLTVQAFSPSESPVRMAHIVRANILNPNLRDIFRYVGVEDDGRHSYSAFSYGHVVSVAYWHLLNSLEGGVVKRCESDGCGGFFIQTDPRQRYCPKRWRQDESPCAMRQRQRRLRRQDG